MQSCSSTVQEVCEPAKTEQVHATACNATSAPKKIRIALLLDTSNSMDGLIDQAKSQLWNIVNELSTARCDSAKPDIQIALYEYGNEKLSAVNNYVRQVLPLTSDLDKVSEALFSLSTKGGEEYCGAAIQCSLDQLRWNDSGNDYQTIVIAGNEPFGQGGVSFDMACKKAKKSKVIVNTIFCGLYEEGVQTQWKEGAEISGGSYMCIDKDSKTVYVPTPYDDRVNELNVQLNATYIWYGKNGEERKQKQEQEDANAGYYGNENKVNRIVAKSSHVYKMKEVDMVDAVVAGTSAADIKAEELPEEMKRMTTEEKKKYVQQKTVLREKITAEILALNVKRNHFIAQQQKQHAGKEGLLQNALLNAVRKQATLQNFQFE